MRKALLYLHMYGGLIAAVYLILLGISSLQFQHHFLPDGPPATTWERSITPPPTDANLPTKAAVVRDQLGLMGKFFNARDTKDGFRFDLYRPGRGYVINVSAAGAAKIEERRLTSNIV